MLEKILYTTIALMLLAWYVEDSKSNPCHVYADHPEQCVNGGRQ